MVAGMVVTAGSELAMASATGNGTPPRPKAGRCPVRKRGLVDQPHGGGPAQRGWGYNPPNTCAMRIFATIATG